MSATLIIIVLTSLVSLVAFSQHDIFNNLKHYPFAEQRDKSYYRWLTGGLLHGDEMHLFINMYVLYLFGRYVESYITMKNPVYGSWIYIILYFLIMVMANIPTYYKYRNSPHFSSVGASGAVTGLVFIFILLNPWELLYVFFAIPIPAILFGILYLWYSSWAADKNRDNIDHYGHFFGAVAGLLSFIILSPEAIRIFIHKFVNDFPL
ncbi:MAG: rhomboid family intramembrane serine protease [Lewinellaceae bacterium]|nr:rhomboid family intramembrane serine protease [Lewinellaceae bacterium]